MRARTGAICAAILVASAAIFAGHIKSLWAEDQANIEELLKTRTTNMGQPIAYPSQGPAEITAVIVTLEPGQQTGRHRHAVPLYGQVLTGQVTVDYGELGSKTYRAGEAFMEAMDTWHNGHNSGDETLRILAVFMGAQGVPNTEKP